MDTFLWIGLILGSTALIAKADLWRTASYQNANKELWRLRQWWDKENMPAELRGARLVMNEMRISSRHPVPLHGKPDQVLQLPSGTLIPVDTKTRKIGQVHPSDIIQLSVYRTILAQKYAGHYPVSDYGYVRLVTPGRWRPTIRYVKVTLLSHIQVANLWHRYHRVRSQEQAPICTCEGKLH